MLKRLREWWSRPTWDDHLTLQSDCLAAMVCIDYLRDRLIEEKHEVELLHGKTMERADCFRENERLAETCAKLKEMIEALIACVPPSIYPHTINAARALLNPAKKD